jgi:hypothetical protein
VDEKTEPGIFQVTEWGVLNFVHLNELFDCKDQSVCVLTESGAQKIRDFTISLIRSWFGLSPKHCFGDCEVGLSMTELVHLAVRQRDLHVSNTIRDLDKQVSVLETIPRLRVTREVSERMAEAVTKASEAVTTHSVFEGVIAAKQAAAAAAEALHHESVKAPSRFSIEYIFALYAPVGLPVVFPLLSALLAHIKRQRAKNT